jgi:putative transposase
MDVKKTSKGTKKFTKAEKLLILSEAKKNGVKKTLDKYALYPGTYYYWKKKFTVYGESGLEHKKNIEDQQLIKNLEKENEALKILLAEKELESKLKGDLLKKKYPELRKRKW